ncbi:Kelch repeat-containing protein [Anaerotignum propionicum]|uniref:Kelch repeat-containing protein n=1 Tax=Anaerotignum propionicum TaxID=28446 RepID=UPI00210E3832|nr:kelch motif-containing protein [Anaerotignum propionicum]MCQ4936414.1 hypothetical protein [Anaerotignum propionicum]
MKKIMVKILSFVVVSVLFLPITNVYANEEKTSWIELASIPTERFTFQSEVIDGKIYTTGGSWNIDYTKKFAHIEVYEPFTNTWTNLASMPTAREKFQTAVLDGKLYVIGGSKLGTWELVASTEVYDPTTNTWGKKASMPKVLSDLYGFQTEVVDGKIYVFGVIPDGTRTPITEVYDPSTDIWTILAPMPTSRQGFQTEVIDGKIYAIGGYSGPLVAGTISHMDSLSVVEVYDPATDQWKTLASRCFFQTEVVDGKIYTIGGWNVKVGEYLGKVLSSTEVYDPSVNKWTTLSDMSTARHVFQTEVIDNKIYAIGGAGPFGPDNNLLSAEAFDTSTNRWTTLPSMKKERTFFQTKVINNVIYAIGGMNVTAMESYTVPISTTK